MNVPITFIVDGQATLSVSWPHVPRVGDFVDLSTSGTDERLVRVVKVKWWRGGGECRIDLICRKDEVR